MKCVICKHGETKPGKTSFFFERDGIPYVIQDVPADICSTCDEAYFSDEIVEMLEDSLEQNTVAATPAITRSFVDSRNH